MKCFFHATSVMVLESSSFFISARKKISFVNYPHGLYFDFVIFFASAKSLYQKKNVG